MKKGNGEKCHLEVFTQEKDQDSKAGQAAGLNIIEQ